MKNSPQTQEEVCSLWTNREVRVAGARQGSSHTQPPLGGLGGLSPQKLTVSQGIGTAVPQPGSTSSPFFPRQLSLEATIPSEGGAWQWPAGGKHSRAGGCRNLDLLGWLSQPPGQSPGKLGVVQGSPTEAEAGRPPGPPSGYGYSFRGV